MVAKFPGKEWQTEDVSMKVKAMTMVKNELMSKPALLSISCEGGGGRSTNVLQMAAPCEDTPRQQSSASLII